MLSLLEDTCVSGDVEILVTFVKSQALSATREIGAWTFYTISNSIEHPKCKGRYVRREHSRLPPQSSQDEEES